MKAYLIDSDWETIEEKTNIWLFGRLENNQSFAASLKIEPYFFIKEEDLNKLQKFLSEYKTEKTSFTNFKGEKVIKVFTKNYTELNKLVEILYKKEIETYEADIKPVMRFLIDNGIFGSFDIEGDYDSAEKVDRVYKNPKIKPISWKPKLKVISLDTESSHSTGKLFCIGLYSEGYEKTFLVGDLNAENVVSCSSEEECLIKFKTELIKQDPDIITGWNIINFDILYLKDLFKKYKIPFDIGRTNREASLRIEANFFRPSRANIPGRQVIDAFNLIRDPFIQEAPTIKNAEFDSYSLESVARSLLGVGKLITGKDRHNEIEKIYSTDLKKLITYNLNDCKLAYEILHKTQMLDLTIERSQLTGLSLDRLGASIAAFDSLYIREARNRSLVSPTTRYSQKESEITGGYVMSKKHGIFKNVLVLDFKSLYPNVIRTFNIDPASLLEKKEKEAIESPNKVYFKNQDGILPKIIEKMSLAREKAKKEKRELANYAIKITMNSMFGVLANPNCRYYNYHMANAITHFGQMIIKLTAEQIEKQGYNVIYMDTDSTFVETGLSKEKASELAKKLPEFINQFYKKYIKEKYNRESFLEIEFEKLYLSLMIPPLRVKTKDEEEKAAKKRYAGLYEENGEEKLEIVGLEAIRGDWTEAAKEFQRELLLKLFHNEEIKKFIISYIEKLKSGKLDEKLIYKKSIRKNLDEYTKTTPPHVKAARQLDKLESNVISYYITTEGPEPIQKLRHKIDYDHYIEKQIKPIANQILSLMDKNFDDIVKGSKQKTLF